MEKSTRIVTRLYTSYEKKNNKRSRSRLDYENKESYKWERSHRKLMSRTKHQENLISVSDREADIYEYLFFMTSNNQRFVQRANHNRPIQGRKGGIRSFLTEAMLLGKKEVTVHQRGPIATGHLRNRRRGRVHRIANVEIRSAEVKIKRPDGRNELPQELVFNVVWVREPIPPKGEKALDWLLLTTEPVSTLEETLAVVGHYEKRWLIEQFHQAWKTGCRIEQRAFESLENIQRMYSVTAPIAVRLLQLQALQEEKPELSAESLMSEDEWKCLWAVRYPGKKFPKSSPNIDWVVKSIASLAGWRDTKRTGRIGWTTMWKGWNLFQQHLIGWNAARTQV